MRATLSTHNTVTCCDIGHSVFAVIVMVKIMEGPIQNTNPEPLRDFKAFEKEKKIILCFWDRKHSLNLHQAFSFYVFPISQSTLSHLVLFE